MKKRTLIIATIFAVILSLSVFGISVYATVKQSIAIKNTISFAGKTNNLHFIIDGRITGTTRETDPTVRWEYNYEEMGIVGYDWNVGNIEFKNDNPYEEFHITYTFELENLSNYPMTAKFNGLGELIDEVTKQPIVGINKNTYVNLEGQTSVNGANITIPRNKKATMILKLTVDDEYRYELNCSLAVNFSIEVEAVEPNQ